jgi:hypothetical protein
MARRILRRIAEHSKDSSGESRSNAFYRPFPPQSNFAPAGKETLKLLVQRGQMALDGFPDDLEIDVAVVVDNTVAHTDDLVEGMPGNSAHVSGVKCAAASPATRKRRKTASCVLPSLRNASSD